MKKRKHEPVIIYFCAGSWTRRFPRGSLRCPISLFRNKYRILVVEPPVTILDYIKKTPRQAILKKYGQLRRISGTKMTIFTPRVLLPYSVRLPFPRIIKNIILKLHVQLISSQVKEIFRRLYKEKAIPDIVWGTIFHHADLMEKTPSRKKLAIINDNFPLSPVFTKRVKKEAAQMESRLITESDYIFTTSQTLLDEKSKLNPRAVLMENGVTRLFLPDYRKEREAFAKYSPEAEKNIIRDISRLPHPRIGYIGAINIRLDSRILERMEELPDNYQICLVGNIDDSFPGYLKKKLLSNSSAHFYPFVSHELIPSLFQQFDVLILPFRRNEFTHYINPLKFSEYLTSGKPIVSTPLAEVRRIAAKPDGLVYFVNDPEEFPGKVITAYERDTEKMNKMRIDLARKRTWEKTTSEMRRIIDDLLSEDP